MGEVFFHGQILGAKGFPSHSLFCTYKILTGHNFSHIEGAEEGQTQVDIAQEDRVIWAHPLDIHFSTPTLVGWPKIAFQVFLQDFFGRIDFGLLILFFF